MHLVRNSVDHGLELPDARLAAGKPLEGVVTLSASHRGNQVEIRVSDNGPGVDPAIADRLFEPFSTTKSSGTGLGLAISRTIVQCHRGTITVQKRTPSGASFYVRLPALVETVR